jgi:hypothetical protein
MSRSQYQYQAIVGPVWTAAVAASLAWLPAGNTGAQPQRALPGANQYTATVSVVAAPLFDPAQFPYTITPQPVRVQRALGGTVQPLAYDPAAFPWNAATPIPIRVRAAPRDVTVLPPRQPASFDSATFPWNVTPLSRRLARGVQTWSLLDPFPVPPPTFVPAQFPWTTVTPQPGRRLGANQYTGLVDVASVGAPTVLDPAKFPRSAGSPQPQRRPGANQYTGLVDVAVTAAPVPFDPVKFPWPSAARPTQRLGANQYAGLVDVALIGTSAVFNPAQFPHTATPQPILYSTLRRPQVEVVEAVQELDPSLLQWLPAGEQPPRWRAVAAGRLGISVVDPFPRPAVVYDPRGLQWLYYQRPQLRKLAAGRLDRTVLDVFPQAPVVFDPVRFPWTTTPQPIRIRATRAAEEVCGFQEFDPSLLQWIPVGEQPPRWRAALAIRTGRAVLDVFPRPPAAFDFAQFPQVTYVRPFFLSRRVPTTSLVSPLLVALVSQTDTGNWESSGAIIVPADGVWEAAGSVGVLTTSVWESEAGEEQICSTAPIAVTFTTGAPITPTFSSNTAIEPSCD